MFDVIGVVTFVFATSSPVKFSEPVLFVQLVCALIRIRVLIAVLLPASLSILLSVEKLSRVDVAILPYVLAVALSFAPSVFSYVNIPSYELVLALSMPETGLPLALIQVAIAPYVLPKAIGLIVSPLAYV